MLVVRRPQAAARRAVAAVAAAAHTATEAGKRRIGVAPISSFPLFAHPMEVLSTL
jgi:hypothetical protein